MPGTTSRVKWTSSMRRMPPPGVFSVRMATSTGASSKPSADSILNDTPVRGATVGGWLGLSTGNGCDIAIGSFRVENRARKRGGSGLMYPAIFGRTYPLTNSSEVLAAAASDGYRGVQFNLLSAGACEPAQRTARRARRTGTRRRALHASPCSSSLRDIQHGPSRSGYPRLVSEGV